MSALNAIRELVLDSCAANGDPAARTVVMREK